MNALELTLLLILLLVLVVIAVLLSLAIGETTAPARSWLIWASVIAWISVVAALTILGVFIYRVSAQCNPADHGRSLWVPTLLVAIMFALFSTGILASIAAVDIRRANGSGSETYRDVVLSAIFGILGAGVALIAWLTTVVITARRPKTSATKSSVSLPATPVNSSMKAE